MKTKISLSVVIPVYNEEKRIKRGISEIIKFLRKQKYSWELVVVDDGSSDRTRQMAIKLLRNESTSKVINSQHLGKGGAIKKGVQNASGKWLVFMDIDLATPIEELEKFMKKRKNHDILIGSRKMKGSEVLVHQAAFREFGGKIFTLLTNLFITGDISDVTCGFKFYKTQIAKELFNKSRLSDWSFDAEILFLAKKSGYSIKEIPVRWQDDPHTKVNLFKDTINSFAGLVKIRYYDITGKYD